MININDIRIGNIMHDNLNNRQVTVHGIEANWENLWVSYDIRVFKLNIKYLTYIKLSIENIDNYTMPKNNGLRILNMPKHEDIELSILETEGVFYLFINGSPKFIKKITYINELQNIAYMLTGNELKTNS